MPDERMITDHRAAWRQFCEPRIRAGTAFVYGSPEYLEYERLKREMEAEEKAGNAAAGQGAGT